MHFSAYRLYEKTGDYHQAFLNLEKANQHKRSELNYDFQEEQACHEFYKTDRVVKTLSSTQVRQPIFQNGIERWKPYEKQLEPLVDALKSVGIAPDS